MKYIYFIPLVLFVSCTKTKDSQSMMSKPVENIKPTESQVERRNASEAFCQMHDVPVYANKGSLYVDSDENVTIRTQDDVVNRALALCYLGVKSEGLEKQHLEQFDKRYRILEKLSPQEKAYALAQNPTEQQTVNANWRYESLHVMLWALGFVDSLSYPSELCNVAEDVKLIFPLTEDQFREKAKLRSKKEILDQADLILRLHWACVSARVKGAEAPGGLNPSVVYERHYSLNWLIKYMDQTWDEVSTDT